MRIPRKSVRKSCNYIIINNKLANLYSLYYARCVWRLGNGILKFLIIFLRLLKQGVARRAAAFFLGVILGDDPVMVALF